MQTVEIVDASPSASCMEQIVDVPVPHITKKTLAVARSSLRAFSRANRRSARASHGRHFSTVVWHCDAFNTTGTSARATDDLNVPLFIHNLVELQSELIGPHE